jgi:tetratricopeptide (TPR) repeat protein
VPALSVYSVSSLPSVARIPQSLRNDREVCLPCRPYCLTHCGLAPQGLRDRSTGRGMGAGEEAKNDGNTALNDGRLEDAIACYSKAIELEPENHVFYSNRYERYPPARSSTR